MDKLQQIFTKENLKKSLVWFFFSFIWLFLLMYALDLLSKQLIVQNRDQILTLMSQNNAGIILIPGFLAVSYVINDSLAFGISINDNPVASRAVYITCALIGVAIIVGIYAWKYKKLSLYVKACLMLILSGAIGNLTDRIFYNASFLGTTGKTGVVDWINFYGIWKFNFNWADSCIVVGVIMLIIWLIVEEVKEYKKEKASQPVVVNPGKVLSKEEQTRLEKDQANEIKKKEAEEQKVIPPTDKNE